MSLERRQAAFLVYLGELLKKAGELGFLVTGGELYRTTGQQALYVLTGRSSTMKSQHLKRMAIDLNFYREQPDGSLDLVYSADALRPLGEFWESLDSANRWGGTGGASRISRTSRDSMLRSPRRRRPRPPRPVPPRSRPERQQPKFPATAASAPSARRSVPGASTAGTIRRPSSDC